MRLFNCDAFDYMRDLPDKSVDLMLTDPMYNAALDMRIFDRICKGHIIMFCAPEKPFFTPDELAYWVKTPSTKNYTKHLGRFVEWILIWRRGNVFNADLHWSNYTGIYDDRILEKTIHPFQKPTALLERLIRIYSKPGDLVFDPFAGSGSTGEACQRAGRRFVGCEIDAGYYSAAAERLGLK